MKVSIGSAVAIGVVVLAGLQASALSMRPFAAAPGSRCVLFPGDSIWNTRIDGRAPSSIS